MSNVDVGEQRERGDRDRLRVRLVSDSELVRNGMESMLESHVDQIRLSMSPSDELPETGPLAVVDVTLLDDGPGSGSSPAANRRWTANPVSGKVLLYTPLPSTELSTRAGTNGCVGTLDYRASGDDVVRLIAGLVPRARRVRAGVQPSWPGAEFGLSARESELVTLIGQGLTNHDICASLFLSINTVKSHIRSAYRKLGITRRSEAVRWIAENGFAGGEAIHVGRRVA